MLMARLEGRINATLRKMKAGIRGWNPKQRLIAEKFEAF
jgi:hypothetical protein